MLRVFTKNDLPGKSQIIKSTITAIELTKWQCQENASNVVLSRTQKAIDNDKDRSKAQIRR